MSAAVSVSLDGVRIPVSRRRVGDIARTVLASEGVSDAMLSITFVTNTAIRTLNRKHLHRAGVTDVISFGFRPSARRAPVVGDVYIAPDVARASARDNGVSIREEIARLTVHGVLHVLGYDHPEGDRRTRSAMWRKQERLVQRVSGE